MKPKILFEVCVDSVDSALAAQEGGADRIELCSVLSEGGITPSHALIEQALSKINIPINVLIRPRPGDFCYSENEFEIMKRDIEFVKSLELNGVVFGILNIDGTIDKKRNTELIEYARPMSVTFHRAFDLTPGPFEALELLILMEFDRILTSGHESIVPEGLELLKALVKRAGDKIIVIPGGGVNENNVKHILNITNAKEIHSSASVIRKNDSTVDGSKIIGRSLIKITSVEKVKAIVSQKT